MRLMSMFGVFVLVYLLAIFSVGVMAGMGAFNLLDPVNYKQYLTPVDLGRR